jgi:hypothetical protein
MAKLDVAKLHWYFLFLAIRVIDSQNGYTHLGCYPMKIARIYLRVSADEQDLTR